MSALHPFRREPVVWLVTAGRAKQNTLGEAESTLAEFGLSTQHTEGETALLAADQGTNWKSGRTRAVIVASPDGELPSRWARATGLPTLRVPMATGEGKSPLDLLQDGAGQLPAGEEGTEFATMAVGAAGAKNAALFVVAVLATSDTSLRARWVAFRERQTAAVLTGPALPPEA